MVEERKGAHTRITVTVDQGRGKVHVGSKPPWTEKLNVESTVYGLWSIIDLERCGLMEGRALPRAKKRVRFPPSLVNSQCRKGRTWPKAKPGAAGLEHSISC